MTAAIRSMRETLFSRSKDLDGHHWLEMELVNCQIVNVKLEEFHFWMSQ
jgi:hypothetical protein